MARLTDEIVEEIHAVRQQHAVRFNYDLDRIIDDLRSSQDKRVAEGWPLIKVADIESKGHPLCFDIPSHSRYNSVNIKISLTA